MYILTGTLVKPPCLRKNAGRAPSFELYPGIRLTTEEKARKNLSQGSRKVPFGHDSISRTAVFGYSLQFLLANHAVALFMYAVASAGQSSLTLL